MILELQDLIVARLQSEELFCGPPMVTVMSEKISDLQNRIDRQVAKIGMGAVILVTSFIRGPVYRSAIANLSLGFEENVGGG